jgi:hypothetical protein
LKQTTTIQRAKAIFLLLLLAVGIAPKAFFHDLIANHKDLPSCNQHHKTAVFHYQEYNCHFDDLVVTTPYLFENEQPVAFIQFYFEGKQSSSYSFHLPHFSQHKENRGPPTA